MKTFNQLLPDDFIFIVNRNEMKYSSERVSKVDSDTVYIGRNYELKRANESEVELKEKGGFYSADKYRWFFANETDAMRYCKAQMMKTLFNKIEAAKNKIAEIKAFREENFELLNHSWTEDQIQSLEKQLAY